MITTLRNSILKFSPKFKLFRCFSTGQAHLSISENVLQEALEKHQIIPDLLEDPPKEMVKIVYNGEAGCGSVDLGNELTPYQVMDVPSANWNAHPRSYYAICMSDPDAPSRSNPKAKEWKHWLVGNIPGEDVKKGETLAEYVGAGPPKGTGLHRYVFFVYRQNGKLEFKGEKRLTKKSPAGRANFSMRKFAEKYDLGTLVAMNYFMAEWDEYVPKLYRQLGMK